MKLYLGDHDHYGSGRAVLTSDSGGDELLSSPHRAGQMLQCRPTKKRSRIGDQDTQQGGMSNTKIGGGSAGYGRL